MAGGGTLCPVTNQEIHKVISANGLREVIFAAAIEENMAVLEHWVSLEKSMDIMDENGNTLLQVAVNARKIDSVKFILKNRVNTNLCTNQGDHPYQPPLYIAMKKGYKQIALECIKHGANVNILPRGGPFTNLSMIFVCAKKSNFQGLQMLFLAGAVVRERELPFLADTHYNCRSLVNEAVHIRHISIRAVSSWDAKYRLAEETYDSDSGGVALSTSEQVDALYRCLYSSRVDVKKIMQSCLSYQFLSTLIEGSIAYDVVKDSIRSLALKVAKVSETDITMDHLEGQSLYPADFISTAETRIKVDQLKAAEELQKQELLTVTSRSEEASSAVRGGPLLSSFGQTMSGGRSADQTQRAGSPVRRSSHEGVSF